MFLDGLLFLLDFRKYVSKQVFWANITRNASGWKWKWRKWFLRCILVLCNTSNSTSTNNNFANSVC